MARKRPGIYDEIFNLEVGQDLTIDVPPGEMAADMAERLKVRFSKWRKLERTFRLKIVGETVCVQRVMFGQGGKLADWRAMKPDTYLLLKTKPTPRHVKKAQGIIDHLMKQLPGPGWKPGSWIIDRHKGQLLAFCAEDVEGNVMEGYIPAPNEANTKPLWAGEWP